MAYSLEQKQMLEAMGLKLYVPVTGFGSAAPAKTDDQSVFWQSPLGRNILRHAHGRDLAALPIPAGQQGKLAKRMVWQQLRVLLKSR